MTKALAFVFAMLVPLPGMAASQAVTWTGWFADEACAKGRVASGVISFTNPDCAEKCIKNGSAPVFISEQAKAMYKVVDYSGVVENLGWKLEITGTVNDDAKTVSVTSVKKLSEVVSKCYRPKRKQ